jgi:hypothetical protein
MFSTTAETCRALRIGKVRLNELARKGKITRGPKANQWDINACKRALGRNLDVYQASPARGDVPPKSTGRKGQTLAAARSAGSQQQRHGEEGSPPRGSLAHAQLLHEQAKAAKAGIEARKMEGTLIDRAAVEAEWTGIGTKVRDAVMSLPSRIINRLPAEWRRELKVVVEEEARLVLAAISDEIRSDPKAV